MSASLCALAGDSETPAEKPVEKPKKEKITGPVSIAHAEDSFWFGGYDWKDYNQSCQDRCSEHYGYCIAERGYGCDIALEQCLNNC